MPLSSEDQQRIVQEETLRSQVRYWMFARFAFVLALMAFAYAGLNREFDQPLQNFFDAVGDDIYTVRKAMGFPPGPPAADPPRPSGYAKAMAVAAEREKHAAGKKSVPPR